MRRWQDFWSSSFGQIQCYIDAAQGVHQNMKSHAGAVTTLGRGTTGAASSAIDMNAKSACESEYIALSISSAVKKLHMKEKIGN